MIFYLYDSVGFEWGTFASFMDAYEEMEKLGWDDLFITTNKYPHEFYWK